MAKEKKKRGDIGALLGGFGKNGNVGIVIVLTASVEQFASFIM